MNNPEIMGQFQEEDKSEDKIKHNYFGGLEPEEKLKSLINETKSNKDERRKKIVEFKENIIIQREKIAKIALFFEDVINKTPDITYKEMEKLLEDKKEENLLSEKQVEKISEKLRRYTIVHNSVNEVFGHYHEHYGKEWQKKLFEDCFDFTPKGKLEINILPLTIGIKSTDIQDYSNMLDVLKNNYFRAIERKKISFLDKIYSLTDLSTAGTLSVGVFDMKRGKFSDQYKKNLFGITIISPLADNRTKVHESRHGVHFNLDLDNQMYNQENLDLTRRISQKKEFIEESKAKNNDLGNIYKNAEYKIEKEINDRYVSIDNRYYEKIKNGQMSEEVYDQELQNEIKNFIDNKKEKYIEMLLEANRNQSNLAFKSEILARYEPADMNTDSFLCFIFDFLYNKKNKIVSSNNIEKNKERKKYLKPSLEMQYYQNINLNKNSSLGYKFNNVYYTFDRVKNVLRKFNVAVDDEYLKSKVTESMIKSEKEMLRNLVAVEILGKYTKLKLKEVMWLLQNEPINNWYKIVCRGGEEIKKELDQEYLNKLKEIEPLIKEKFKI